MVQSKKPKAAKHQKMRIDLKRAARRSKKLAKQEGKVSKSKTKKKFTVSQKKTATVKKSRY